MSHVDYDRIDAIRWSRLKAMRVSPKQYRHELEQEREDAVHFRVGRAAHKLLLERDTFDRDYAIFDGTRRGKAWDAFKAEHAKREIITPAELERAQGCAEAIRRHPLASKHLLTGAAEHVLVWTDQPTGLKCKARVDLKNGHLVEIKTTSDLDRNRWPAQCARYGYFGQLAFYFDGVMNSGGFDPGHEQDPVQIVVQSEAPFDLLVFTVPPTTLEHGRREYRRCLDRLAECMRTGKWPGSGEDREVLLYPPAWAEDDEGDDQPITLGGVALSI